MEEKNYKIYDSLYNVIGVAPYEEVHTQGLLHQVVHFWLVEKKDDQLWLYLQKRAKDDIVYKGAYIYEWKQTENHKEEVQKKECFVGMFMVPMP